MDRPPASSIVAGVVGAVLVGVAVANGLSTPGGLILAGFGGALLVYAVLGERFKSAGPKGVEAFPVFRDREVRRVIRVTTAQAPQTSVGRGVVVRPDTARARVETYPPTIHVEGNLPSSGDVAPTKIPGPGALEAAEQAMREAGTPEELADRIVEYVQLRLFSDELDAE